MGDFDPDDCLQRQIDEIEALSAIYEDEWCCVSETSRIYCIGLDERSVGNVEKAKWPVSLQVILPDDYPVRSPPIYQLNAPWLRGEERIRITSELEDLYTQNLGESIIYLWVEKIREFLQNRLDDEPSSVNKYSHETEFDLADEFAEYRLVDDDSEWNYEKEVHETTSDDLQCPDVHHGEPFTDRRSTFQAHLAHVTSRNHVTLVLNHLLSNKKIANATHNIYAYRILDSSTGRYLTGCDDDGETHAGSRMMHLLKVTEVENVLVVVSRWYGGILLGPDRFKHINNVTRNILMENGYIKSGKEAKPRTDKRGGKSSGGKS